MSKGLTILIGAQKAGTSSLYDWISQHEEVFGNIAIKDYHFFSNDKFYNKGIDHFLNFFKGAQNDQIQLAGAVNYIYFSEIAASRIKAFDPLTKFIVVLRDPIKRAFSAYNFFKKNGEETAENFELALQKEEDSTYTSHEMKGRYTYLDHGYYFKQLNGFLKHFPKDQLLVLVYEDLVKNKEENLSKVFDFLNVSKSFKPEFKHLNKTGDSIEQLEFLLQINLKDYWQS